MMRAALARRLIDRTRDAAWQLQAIANPNRLRMVCQLFDHPKMPTNLGFEIGITSKLASQELHLLRMAGLVTSQKHGRHRFYGLDESRIRRSVTGPSIELPGGYRLHFDIGNQPRPSSYPLVSVVNGTGVGDQGERE